MDVTEKTKDKNNPLKYKTQICQSNCVIVYWYVVQIISRSYEWPREMHILEMGYLDINIYLMIYVQQQIVLCPNEDKTNPDGIFLTLTVTFDKNIFFFLDSSYLYFFHWSGTQPCFHIT